MLGWTVTLSVSPAMTVPLFLVCVVLAWLIWQVTHPY